MPSNTPNQHSRVAMIIVSWNNKDLLPECIEAIDKQTYTQIDTYLIDNGSHDGTMEFLKSNYPEVNVIDGVSNLGFAKGNNVAIAHALKQRDDYGYFVLVNTDARMAPNWTERVIAFAKHKPTGALFQSITLDYYDHSIIDSTHIYVSPSGQGTQAGWREPHMGPLGPLRVFGVNAAVAMISRSFLDSQPLDMIFDERMFMYLEDVDLSARATVLGWENYLVPGTEAYHMGSASSGKNPGFSLYMTFRNNSAMLLKNFPPHLLFRILPKLVRGDYYMVKHLVRLGDKRAALKVVKGRFVGVIRLPLYFKDIRIMARNRVIDNDYLYALLTRGYR